jgi:HSP20 family protein
MAKNDKGKTVAVTKGGGQKGAPTIAPTSVLSPLRAWEREMERMFEDFPFFRWPRLRDIEAFRFPREMRLQMPSLDMYEEADDIVVKAELPGISKDELEVNLTGSTLTIKGEKKREEEVKKANYFRSEREYGSIYRSLDLPAEVKAEEVKATFKDGVLEIRLPKTEAAKKKAVRVTVA